MRLITILFVLSAISFADASDRKQRGRAAWAWAVSQQTVAVTPNVTPKFTPKSCPCSNECVCGCNSGKPCDCNKVKAATVIESATCTTGT